MRTLVVHESWFGNTRALAEAIAAALAPGVELLTVDDPLPPLEEVDLLVVGAPTHVHGMSSATSRRAALERRGDPLETGAGAGVRGWLRALPPGDGRRVAVFDTRAAKPAFLVGSAARVVARRLERKGYTLVARPESFFIVDTEGPLAEGELERARAWAGALAPAAAAVR
jgi:hypothetical protein